MHPATLTKVRVHGGAALLGCESCSLKPEVHRPGGSKPVNLNNCAAQAIGGKVALCPLERRSAARTRQMTGIALEAEDCAG